MTRRLAILFGVYLTIVLSAALIFDIAEGRDFWSSVWWAIVTATTVGYGDLSPSTATGRAVAIVLMHLTTLLLLPLLTAEIAAKLIVDSDAFTHDEQEAIKHALERVEAHLARLDAERDAQTGATVSSTAFAGNDPDAAVPP